MFARGLKKHFSLVGFLVVCCIAALALVYAEREDRVAVGAPTPRPDGAGWIDLFDASHMAQWTNVTDSQPGIFEFKDGMFHVAGKTPTRYIALMGETFGDFELHVEFKVAKGANSGVFFRTDPQNPVQGGFEIQVLDDAGQAPSKNSSGSLYDVASPMFNMARPTGEWNSYDITCLGSNLAVMMNGWKVIDVDFAKMTMPIGKFDTPLAKLPKEGNIVLQDHGGEVWFRNLVIRKL
jgi:hypothetical protein